MTRAALALALAAPLPAAAAEMAIHIDCHELWLPKTSSPNALKVEVFVGGSTKPAASKSIVLQDKYPNPADPATCPIPAPIYGFLPDPLVRFEHPAGTEYTLVFTATGSNAIWIDAVFFVELGRGTSQRGVDGGKGWCLSTDPDDTFGSDRQDGGCKKSVTLRSTD